MTFINLRSSAFLRYAFYYT